MPNGGTVELTPEAVADLEEIFLFIARESGERRAMIVKRRIEAKIEIIAHAPYAGRVRDDLQGAPRSIPAHPWVVVYDPLPGRSGVVVLRVIHGSRDLPRHFRRT